MSEIFQKRWMKWFACLSLVLVTFAVYWQVQSFDFIRYDDPDYVTQNHEVNQGLTWDGFKWAFRTGHASNWHPLTWLSHMLDCQLFGLNPHAQHSVNLAFHVLNCVLLLLLLNQLTKKLWRSAMVAGLFALHPIHVESVAWISERKDVLSTLFWLLTMTAYVAYIKSSQPRNAKYFYALSLAFFVLGLMAKPMLVTLPFVLILIDLWPLERLSPKAITDHPKSFIKLLTEKTPFLIFSTASCIVTFLAQKNGGAITSFDHLPFSERTANAVFAYGKYLLKLAWPSDLAIIYPYSESIPSLHTWGTSAIVLAMTVCVILFAIKKPYLATGWFWFLGTLVPVIGLVQVGSQSMADRYTYIPAIGIFIIAVWLVSDCLSQIKNSRLLLGLVSVALLLSCAVATQKQTRYWKNTVTLFRHTVEVTDKNPIAQSTLGGALVEEGKIEEGISYLQQALGLKPDYALAHGQLASALAAQGKILKAISEYEEALKLRPDLFEALNNFSWLLATCPNPEFRNGPKAVALAEKACQLTNFQNITCMGTLAAAYAEVGRFDEAIATAETAKTLALSYHDQALADKNEELQNLYRARQAFHQNPQSSP